MKKLFAFVFFLVLGVFLFVALFSTIKWAEVWNTLLTFSLFEGLVVFLLTGVSFFVGAVKWQRILKGQGVFVPLSVIWKAYLAAFSISFFLPMLIFGAELFRAYTLKNTHNVSSDKGMASVVIDRVLETTSSLIIVLLGIFVFFFWGTPFSLQTAVAIGAGLLVIALLLFFFYFRMFKGKSIVGIFMRRRRGNNIVEIENEISHFFRWKNPAVRAAFFLAFLKSFVGLIRVWALMIFLGKTLIFLPALTVLGIYYVAVLIPIPAALGSHDALQALAFQSFGLGAAVGAAFAFVIRAIEVVFALVGIGLTVHLGIGLIRSSLVKKIQRIFR